LGKKKMEEGRGSSSGKDGVKPIEMPFVKGMSKMGCCCSCKYSVDEAPDWAPAIEKGYLWCTKWSKGVSKDMYAIACWRPMI